MTSRNVVAFLPPGGKAFLQVQMLVFVAYVVVVVLRAIGPVTAAVAAAQGGPGDDGMLSALLSILVVFGFVVLVLGYLVSVLLFDSVHNVEVVLESSVTMDFGEVPVLSSGTYDVAGTTFPLSPRVLFPPEATLLFYLLPPVLLFVAGYRTRLQSTGILRTAGAVAGSYALIAVWQTVFASILFSLFTDFLLFAAPIATDATLTVRVVDPVVAFLVVGVAYPAVFGALGAVAAEVVRG
jgi:hypothetical protein